MKPGTIQMLYLPRKLYEKDWTNFVLSEEAFNKISHHPNTFVTLFLNIEGTFWSTFNITCQSTEERAIHHINQTIPIYPHLGYGFVLTPFERGKEIVTPHELFRVV